MEDYIFITDEMLNTYSCDVIPIFDCHLVIKYKKLEPIPYEETWFDDLFFHREMKTKAFTPWEKSNVIPHACRYMVKDFFFFCYFN
jgi:hypothetical protein